MLQNALNKKSYLVVDDLGDMRSVLRSMLTLFGATDIDNAKNGADAIHKMESKKYDVVLCDYNLGAGKDGQQVLEEARHRHLISVSTAFIMITAENTVTKVLGAIEYEPDGYLNKPFTKDLLRSRLEKVLTKKLDLRPIDLAMKQKDYAKAIQLLDERIASKPKNLGELIRLKGDICVRSGALTEAAALYEGVLAAREMTWARMGLGKACYGLKKFEDAKQIFQDLIDANDRFTAAYDWLARTLKALGDVQGSQQVLTTAVKISPKAILRQQELGALAMENNDYDTAEAAFRQAVELGKHSIHKHPKLYVGLTESRLSSADEKQKQSAFKIIQQMQREFKGDLETEVYAAITTAMAHRGLGEEEKALESLALAEQLFERFGSHASPDLTLSMAKLNAGFDDEDKAKALFLTVIKNNHDDDEFLREVEAALNASGFAELARELISSTRKEIIALNNEGVRLVADGQIAEAIGLFEKAVEGMSGNKAINLNAAKVLIMHMEKNGLDTQFLAKAKQYLERVQTLDPNYKGLPKLFERLNKLVNR